MQLDQAYNQAKYLNFLSGKFNFSKTLTPITIDNKDVKTSPETLINRQKTSKP
ncbi:MAG: hypothetical protein HFP76_00320 [Methylococcales symbiont of Iophon sp. n. MRB-2018]|nr:MAG: hypothetical protein HFP76_00320 [Methylococcales symbiont of Iophon sp. n. MRB-2018]